jgi:hypothetical protein
MELLLHNKIKRPRTKEIDSIDVKVINRPDNDQQHCYHHAPKVKPETPNAVVQGVSK